MCVFVVCSLPLSCALWSKGGNVIKVPWPLSLISCLPLPNFASPSGPWGLELGVWVSSWAVPNLILVRRLRRLPKIELGTGQGNPDPKFRARRATWGGKLGEWRAGVNGPWPRHLFPRTRAPTYVHCNRFTVPCALLTRLRS
jgi:hypothetical protein